MFQWFWSLFSRGRDAQAGDRESAPTLAQFFILSTLRLHGDQTPEHDEDEYVDVFYRYDAEHREVSCYATTCGSPYYDGDGMIRVSVGSWEEFLLDLRGLLHESDQLYPDREYPCVIVSAALPSSYALPHTYRCRIERIAPTPIDPKAFAGSTDYDCEAGCCGCMCD